MAERRIGIIMHGVTGRMGMNQHLIRSVLAIRAEGGVALADGTRRDARAAAGRPRSGQARGARRRPPHRPLDPRPRRRAGRPAVRGVLRRRLDPAARRAAAARDRRRQARLLREADRRPAGGRAGGLARRRGRRHPARRGAGQALAAGAAQAQDADRGGLLRPHPRRQGRLRLLGVRGRLAAAQRPSWNYKKAEGGGIILDMLCHWRYVLDNLFGAVKSVFCLGANHIPERVGERGERYAADSDDAAYAIFELEGGIVAQINSSWCTRVRRDDLVVLPGRRHPRLGARRPHQMLGAAAGRDAAPGLEPGRRHHAGLSRPLAGGAGQPELRQRLQGGVGAVPAPRRGRLPDFRWNLLEGAKGVQLAELGYRSWSERRMLDVPPLEP